MERTECDAELHCRAAPVPRARDAARARPARGLRGGRRNIAERPPPAARPSEAASALGLCSAAADATLRSASAIDEDSRMPSHPFFALAAHREPSSRRSAWLRSIGGPLAVVALVASGSGCTFEGYVPKGPPPRPLEAPEANIADLAIGDTVSGDLDCTAGRCRVRYRIVAPSAGELVVRVDGPAGSGERGDVGARLARAVLEGIAQQTLAIRMRSEGPPPFEVRSAVQPGIHYVLVQGLGGPLDYTVSARFVPGEGQVVEPHTELAMSDPPAAKRRKREPVERTVVPLQPAARGDLSDGADYAADPDVDVTRMRRYAFAQDPAAMLRGEPGSNQGDPFLLRQIQREIRYVLADRGLQQVAVDEAEFLVAVGVGSKSTTWYGLSVPGFAETYEYYFDQWYRAGVGVTSHTYQDGTLMIDFIDPRDGRLLWHGWTVEPIPLSGDQRTLLRKFVGNVLGQL